MKSDGTRLEELVRFVEETLQPQGYEVTCRERPRDADGYQTAELDIVIRRVDGDKPFVWLIECRDRRGRAPISWIEQLMGRRIRLGLGKVSAVSTTGFSKVATKCAQEWGIELREVKALAREEFAALLLTSKAEVRHRSYAIHSFYVEFHEDESDERKNLASLVLDGSFAPGCKNAAVLSFGGESVRMGLKDLVDQYVLANRLAEGVEPGVPVRLDMYCKREPDCDDPWGVETSLGLVKVTLLCINFELLVIAETRPISGSAQYRSVGGVGPITQSYSFSVSNYMGQKADIELLTLKSTGQSYVSVVGTDGKRPVVLLPYTLASQK